MAILAPPAAGQCAFQQKLAASPLGEYDQFGYSVAISGNTAIVGAPMDDHSYGTNAGSASIYLRVGTTWTLQQSLVGTDGFASSNQFGFAVAVSGDTAAIGTPYDDHGGYTDRGSVYIYVRSGSTWFLQQVLAAGDPASYDNFGYSVGLSGNTLIVGTMKTGGANPPQGAAYIFQRSGSVWSQQQKLIDSNPNAGDYFGWSVAISEDANTAVVGAIFDDQAGSDTGSASVFTRSGSFWSLQAKLTASDPGAYEYFGQSVSISNNTVAVGSGWDNHAGGSLAGSVYVFQRSGFAWSQQAKLIAGDAAGDDQLGWSVGISGETIAAGALGDDSGALNAAGAAYIFQRSGSAWTQQSKFTSTDPDALGYFGSAVAISNGTAVAGSPRDTHSGVYEPGAATVFACPVPLPAQANSPSPANGATGVVLNADLAWTNGGGATSFNIYFGTDPTPDASEFLGNQAATFFALPTLPPSIDHFWRIDAVNATGTTTGVVWTFRTRSADLNGDGVINVDDLLEVIANFDTACLVDYSGSVIGSCTACEGDVDGNCVINIDDLLLVIANWTF